ncbi:MAG: hypothetical protein M1828_006499 [Chrysothrix sp. TS-e1954]|nr:MAG: hypothetical protein M1828_006499 [Chrysothrix sp. TS-e1954]
MRLQPLPSLRSPTLQLFQDRAFNPALPHVLPAYATDPSHPERRIPALSKWFLHSHGGNGAGANRPTSSLNIEYLLRHLETAETDPLVPLEVTRFAHATARHPTSFETTQAPLSEFLRYLSTSTSSKTTPTPTNEITHLYLSQSPLPHTLPPSLLPSLPTPTLALRAGRGDIYLSSLWLGTPPTYTPLHKDPNDNLFVQLVGCKLLRIMDPGVGGAVLREGRRRAGMSGRGVGGVGLRGEEMMVGRERVEVDALVWGADGEQEDTGENEADIHVFEAEVQPGDACYIPRGWWHSIRGLEEEGSSGLEEETGQVVGSVNWWFR